MSWVVDLLAGASAAVLGPEAGVAVEAGGNALLAATSGSGSSGGGYPNSTASTYHDDYTIGSQHLAGQIPDAEILALVQKASATDLGTLRSTYLAARPKAIWTDVIPSYPWMVAIAAAGGGDFARTGSAGPSETALYNALVSLLAKYQITATSAAQGAATPAPAPATASSSSSSAAASSTAPASSSWMKWLAIGGATLLALVAAYYLLGRKR